MDDRLHGRVQVKMARSTGVASDGKCAGETEGAISGSIKSKIAADGHLGMTALSRVTLASAGLSC